LIEAERCTLCNKCVEVCPRKCLEIILRPPSSLRGRHPTISNKKPGRIKLCRVLPVIALYQL
jgi:formate hydrogenlyase subunit 6/NADH:ubiquinone oxidoreductase subunit I